VSLSVLITPDGSKVANTTSGTVSSLSVRGSKVSGSTVTSPKTLSKSPSLVAPNVYEFDT
jgi:hypothetical protein